MKTKMLNIVSMLLLLNMLVACGGDGSSTKTSEVQNSSVNITVEKPSGQNVYFSKTSNVDLVIASMKIDVYKTDDETDEDVSDNTLVNTKALTKDATTWKGTLTALEKESIYIFDVSAKNASDQIVFRGKTTQKIETGVTNDIDIKLAQPTDLYDNNVDNVPTASNITASKDANGNIALSFNIVNLNEESVTWSLYEAGGTTLSTEFFASTGTTSNEQEAVRAVYTKDVNSNNKDYVLELKSTEGEIRYAFNIDFDAEELSVTVNTPPIIESLNVVVEGDTLTITPVLDRESSDVSYVWSFTGTPLGSETITNANEKVLVISGYDENSQFTLRLKVFENASSSFREYKIGGYKNNTIEEQVESNDNLDVVNSSYLTIISPQEGSQLSGTTVFFKWNLTLTTLEFQSIKDFVEVYINSSLKTFSKGDSPFTKELIITYTKTGFYLDNLPSDGSEIEVRITPPTKGDSIVYKYIAYNSSLKKATMKAPSEDLKLRSRFAYFIWDDTGAESYSLYIGTQKGSSDIKKYTNLTVSINFDPNPFPGGIPLPGGNPGGIPIPGGNPGGIPIPGGNPGGLPIPGGNPGGNPGGIPIPGGNPGGINFKSTVKNSLLYNTELRQIVSRLSVDKKIYVRLISKINGEDKYNDYVYRVVLPSVMKTPSSDAYLSSDEVTFKWDNFGSSTLKLLVGKSESDGSYYDSTVSGTSQIVSNLPKDGSKVYVRLSSYINNTWVNRDSSYTAMTTTASNNGTCEFTVNHYRQYLAPLTMGAITYPLLVGSKLNFSGDRHFAKVENTGEHDIEIKYNRRKRTLAPGENKTMYTPLWRLSSVECLTTTSEKRGLFESFRDEVLASGGDIIEDTGDLIYTVGDTVATALVETLGLTGDNLPAEMIALIQFLDEGLAIDATVTATIMYTLVVDGIDEAMKTLHDTLLEDRGSIINGRNLTCDDNLGNTDEAFSSKDKFKNMILNDEYSDINNYLMIQASAKTYPHNFHHNRTATRRPKTTNDFQCAAKELYEHWGFDEISYVNTLESVNAIVASNEDMVLIAIRGTESPYFGYIGNENSELDPSRLTGLNGIMDVLVTTSKVPYQIGLFPYTDSSTPEAKVHLGYARSSYIFAYYLRKVFNEIDGFEGKKVYITGHSLGGATAIMTSYFLQNHSTEPIYNIEATYAFASPEIGDAEFTRALYNDGSPYYMTINYRDPIPYVNNKPYERVDFIDQYASSLFGSKYTNIFDAEHKAVAFKGTYSSSSRNEFISTMFGEKRPYVYSSEFGMDEWHFHHTNFYLAYAYKKLLLDGEFLQNGSNITKETFVNKINTGINPEFTRSVTMCMKIDGQVSKPEISWSGDDTYEKLLQDEQSYPFEECDD